LDQDTTQLRNRTGTQARRSGFVPPFTPMLLSVSCKFSSKMLTPENLTEILNKGAIRSDGDAIANMQIFSDLDTSRVFATLKRISFTKPVELMVALGEGEKAGGVSIHFEGNGWKLSGIQLPSQAVQVLAQRLINKRSS
jgi:hypothetical protein